VLGVFHGFNEAFLCRLRAARLCQGCGLQQPFPCARLGEGCPAPLPASRTSNAIHPSNANMQKLQIPRNIFLPQCRTGACTGKRNACPGGPKYHGKRKEKEIGNMQCTLYPLFVKTLGISHLQLRGFYQPLGCEDIPQPYQLSPSRSFGWWGWAAGCSWVLNKQKEFQGSPSPSLNHIWFLFPQLTHPPRYIPLRWISHVARFKGEKTSCT